MKSGWPVLGASRCSWCRRLVAWSRTGWTGSGSSRRPVSSASCRWTAWRASCSGSCWRGIVDGRSCRPVPACARRLTLIKLKVKKKARALDIHVALRSESPLQKRSGMARVLKGFHSFTRTPTRSSAIGMSHTCLCLSSCNWYSFTDPGETECWVGLRGWLRNDILHLPDGSPPIPLLTGLNAEQLRWSRPTRYRYTKPP